MSTALDLILVPAVKTLIDDLGGNATLYRDSHDYDPAAGGDRSSATVSYDVKATPPAPHRDGYAAGMTVARPGLTTLLSAASLALFPLTPMVGDRLAFAAGEFVVTAVVLIQSGDDVCAWQLDVEAG